MNVLSLFDGMSCGMIALDRAGVKVDKYFASEIDKYAIKTSSENYPNIIRIGDVTKIRYENGVLYTELGQFETTIDLVIGGSPCQSFSSLGDGTGLEGKSGLFFHWLRIKEEICPKYFLLENVNMKKEWRNSISEKLNTDSVEINSNQFSAQNRSRLYWTNIQLLPFEDKRVFISDIVDSNVDEKYFLTDKAKRYIISKDRVKKKLSDFARDKSICLVARYTGLNGSFICVDNNGKFDHEKAGCLTARYGKGVATFGGDTYVYDLEDICKEKIRKFTPEECEKLQTVPVGYTKSVSDSQRYKMLGNGWTVDVIAHIFKGLK